MPNEKQLPIFHKNSFEWILYEYNYIIGLKVLDSFTLKMSKRGI